MYILSTQPMPMFILSTQPYRKIAVDQFSQTQKESMEQTYNIYSKLSKFLYFKTICSSYFCTFDINTTVSICASLSKLKLISSAMIGSLNLMDLSH